MRNAFFILTLIVAAVACKPVQQSSSEESYQTRLRNDSTVYIERLRPIKVKTPGESINATINLQCDSNKVKATSGRVIGKRTQLRYQVDSTGRLQIDCNADSLELECWAKDLVIKELRSRVDSSSESRSEIRTETVTKIKYRTPFWNLLAYALLLAILFRRPLGKLIKKYVPWKF
jgi:hypothetical protein